MRRLRQLLALGLLAAALVPMAGCATGQVAEARIGRTAMPAAAEISAVQQLVCEAALAATPEVRVTKAEELARYFASSRTAEKDQIEMGAAARKAVVQGKCRGLVEAGGAK